MSEYLPNSNKFKKESADANKKKVEKVVSGKVKVKKKSELSKLGDIFIAEDVRNVKSYVVFDVLVPAIKKAVYDIVTDGVDMILFGGTGRKKKSTNVDRVSYNRFYNDRDRDRDRSSSRLRGYSFNEITLDSRREAEEVLSAMDDIRDQYGMVTVADLNDLLGVTGEYTDNKYGWTNLRNAEVIRERDGYALKLPRAMAID